MDSFEVNKVLGAVLGTLTFTLGLAIFSEILFSNEAPEQPGYVIEVPETAATSAEPVEEGPSVMELLASADPAAGEGIARRCASCHTFEQGGGNRVGPAMWDVVNRDKGAVDGFGYSSAMAEAEGAWGYEQLDGFLENPRGYLPGTSMSFAGIRRAEERANLIAYLRTLSDNPAPLPEPVAETPEEAPAEGEPPAEGAGETVPDAGQQQGTPAVEGQEPAVDGVAPTGEAPPAGETAPATDGAAPAGTTAPDTQVAPTGEAAPAPQSEGGETTDTDEPAAEVPASDAATPPAPAGTPPPAAPQ